MKINVSEVKEIKYPENINLKKALKYGDISRIAKTAGRSPELIKKIFSGTRRMKPDVRRIYDAIIRFNAELDSLRKSSRKQMLNNGHKEKNKKQDY
jgi:hypothetical protein